MFGNKHYPTVCGSLPHQISMKCVKKFIGCIEKSIYIPMQTRLSYESIWLKIEIAWQSLRERLAYRISTKCLEPFGEYEKSSLMIMCKLGFIPNQCGWKFDFPIISFRNSPTSNASNNCGMFLEYIQSPFVVLCNLGFIVDQCAWKCLMKASHIEFQ
jgi:hypothetical protein